MTQKNQAPRKVSDQALEMVMRDVLDGMLELTLDFGFSGSCGNLEIIDIGAEQHSDQDNPKRRISSDRAEVLHFPQWKKAVG